MNTFTLDEAAMLLSTYGLADNLTITVTISVLVASNILLMIWLGCYRDHRTRLNHVRSGHMNEDEVFAEELRKSRALQRRIASGTFSSKDLGIGSTRTRRADVQAGCEHHHQQPLSEAAHDCVLQKQKDEPPFTMAPLDEFQEVRMPHLPPTPRLSTRSIAWSVEAAEAEPSIDENKARGNKAVGMRSTERTPACRLTRAPSAMARQQQQQKVQPQRPNSRTGPFTPPRIVPQERHKDPVAGRPLQTGIPPTPSMLLASPPASPAASSYAEEALQEDDERGESICDATSTSEGRFKRQERLRQKRVQLEELRCRRIELRRTAGVAEASEAEDLLDTVTTALEQCSEALRRRVRSCFQVLRGFCRRLYENLRSEHTLISFVAPMDEEEALSREQAVQMFFSTVYLELALLCLLHDPTYSSAAEAARDRSGGGGRRQRGAGGQADGQGDSQQSAFDLNAGFFGVSVVTVLTQGLLVAGVAYVMVATFAYVFKLGNSRRRNRGWVDTLRAFSGEVAGQSGLQRSDLSCISYVLCRPLAMTWAAICALRNAPAVVRARHARRMAKRASKAEAKQAAEAAEEVSRPVTARTRRIAFAEEPHSFGMPHSLGMHGSQRLRPSPGMSPGPAPGPPVPISGPRQVRLMPASASRNGIDAPPPTPASRHGFAQRLNHRRPDPDSACSFGSETDASAPSLSAVSDVSAREWYDDVTRGEFGLIIRPLPPIQRRPTQRHSSPPPSPPASLPTTRSDSAATVSAAVGPSAVRRGSKAASIGSAVCSTRHMNDSGVLSRVRLPKRSLTAGSSIGRTFRLGRVSSTKPDMERTWTSAVLPRQGEAASPSGTKASKPLKTRSLSRRFALRQAGLQRSGSGLRGSGAALVGRISASMGVPVQKTALRDGSQVAVVALAALRQKRKADAKWRSNTDRCRRLTLAWAFNLGVSALFIFYALIASLKFGESETAGLFSSWAAAYLYGAVLLEPGAVCIVSAMPCLTSEDTKFGRCCLRVKWCWDELLSP